MGKKRRKQLKPQLGGLAPVRRNINGWKTGLDIKARVKEITFKFRSKNNDYSDVMFVTFEKRFEDIDGMIIPNSPIEMSYAVKDTGDLAEYDVFEESLWNQVDIDNPTYIVDLDVNLNVTRIYWIDGQVDDGDGNMIDNEIEIPPYQKKGRIDPASEVIISAGSEPLAALFAVLNASTILTDIKAQMLAKIQ